MNRPNEYDTPEIYERELANLESRMDKSISLVEKIDMKYTHLYHLSKQLNYMIWV